jgi:hypothetical protein
MDTDDPVWYVAYGSNMCLARLGCYLTGGQPAGARRAYPGCRDPSPPARDVGIRLTGGLMFAGSSTVWGGGMGFYDPDSDAQLAARAYLLTFGQLSDIAAQETKRPVGGDLALGDEGGSGWLLPSHTYETLLPVGERDGFPMFTLTSLRDQQPAAPSAPYLRTVLQGLDETFDWTADERVDYLLQAPGVAPAWTEGALLGLSGTESG